MTLPDRPRNLIIGMAGSGKTTLVEHMQAQGHYALDGDLIEGLGTWQNADGEQVPYQPDHKWRNCHLYAWNRERLIDILFYERPQGNDRPLYLFGTEPNIHNHSFWFHNVLFLSTDATTIYKRLRDPSRRTPYPFKTEQADLPRLERRLNKYQFFNNRYMGYVAINTSQSVAKVADEIVSQCSIPHASPKPQPPMSTSEVLCWLSQ
jgi:shikimate kinase